MPGKSGIDLQPFAGAHFFRFWINDELLKANSSYDWTRSLSARALSLDLERIKIGLIVEDVDFLNSLKRINNPIG